MRASEIREMSNDELNAKEAELVESLALMRLRHKTNQLEGTARLGQFRRDLARVKTIQRQRAAAAGQG